MDFMRTPEKQRVALSDLGNNIPIIPFSPTHNLKLISNVAANSMPIEGYKTPSPAINGSSVKKTRKDKSLFELCKKFLNIFPLRLENNCDMEVCLNETTDQLQTEKRRIYDIINVLESLDMASRAGKNKYFWHGESHLNSTLLTLKTSAIELGLDKKIQDIQKVNRAFILNDSQLNNLSPNNFMVPQSPIINFTFPESSSNDKEDKSLGVMCRKFLMLFLVSLENGVINLDIASKVLITESDSSESSKAKTKGRRLYDIANVLTAIGLIEKVDMCNTLSIKKPIFKYCGPDINSLQAGENEQNRSNQYTIYSSTPKRSISKPYRPFHFRTCRSEGCSDPKKRKLFTSDDDSAKKSQARDLSKKKLNQRSHSMKETLNNATTNVGQLKFKSLERKEISSSIVTNLSSTFSKFISDSSIESPVQMDNISYASPASQSSLLSIHSPTDTPDMKKQSSGTSTESNYLVVTPKLQQTHCAKNIELFKEETIDRQIEQFSDTAAKKSFIVETEENEKTQHSKESVIKVETNNISPGDCFQCVKVGNSLKLVPIKSKSDTK